MDEKRIISDEDIGMVSGGMPMWSNTGHDLLLFSDCESEQSPDGKHKWIDVGTTFHSKRCEYCGTTFSF